MFNSLACNSKRFFLIERFTALAIQLAWSRAITLGKPCTFTVWIFSPKCQTFNTLYFNRQEKNITEVKIMVIFVFLGSSIQMEKFAFKNGSFK